jgi:hypothetical protein
MSTPRLDLGFVYRESDVALPDGAVRGNAGVGDAGPFRIKNKQDCLAALERQTASIDTGDVLKTEHITVKSLGRIEVLGI